MCADRSQIEAFIEAGRKAAAMHLVQCSSGNLSWRTGPDTVLLSASRAWLGELSAEQVAVCRLETGVCVNGKTPTCESGFHLGILKNRPAASVVLHFQSPCATAIACGTPEQYNYNVIIEVPVYIGVPAVVPYLPPGSGELADAVMAAFADSRTQMVFLKNHGLVTVGKDFNEAIQRAVFFELACRILLANPGAEPLSPAAVSRLRDIGRA